MCYVLCYCCHFNKKTLHYCNFFYFLFLFCVDFINMFCFDFCSTLRQRRICLRAFSQLMHVQFLNIFVLICIIISIWLCCCFEILLIHHTLKKYQFLFGFPLYGLCLESGEYHFINIVAQKCDTGNMASFEAYKTKEK